MAINAATDDTGSDVSGVYDDRCLYCYCFYFSAPFALLQLLPLFFSAFLVLLPCTLA